MTSPDVIVVGGGIVGAACADALCDRGRSVLLLDAEAIGCGSTAECMGHIVVMDDSEAQFHLTRYSQTLWDRLSDELPAECDFWRCGTIWVAEEELDLSAVRAKQAGYTARDVRIQVLSPEDLGALEPHLRPGLAGGLLVPGDSVVYPPRAARFLAERAARKGCGLRERTRVRAVHRDGVELTDGTRMAAGAVVNATGIHAPGLTPGLPVIPRKGHLVITDARPGFSRHQLVELGYLRSAHGMGKESVAFNSHPRANGQLIIGSSRQFGATDRRVESRILSRMLERAFAFMPDLAGLTALRAWTGFRPATPDSLPLIGPHPETKGLWIAAGHEGLGITTALGTAQILADLISGATPAIDPAPYRIDRDTLRVPDHSDGEACTPRTRPRPSSSYSNQPGRFEYENDDEDEDDEKSHDA
jgi:D-hydroxyproline dehydrogenase subunit beta